MLGAKLLCTCPFPIHYELEKLIWMMVGRVVRLAMREFYGSAYVIFVTEDDGTVLFAYNFL
jgi:hypothetical protein